MTLWIVEQCKLNGKSYKRRQFARWVYSGDKWLLGYGAAADASMTPGAAKVALLAARDRDPRHTYRVVPFTEEG